MGEARRTPDKAIREWFGDRRSDERRLQVTWHSEQRLVVLSVWHGETCTATFQLVIADAARLVGLLVDSLAKAATFSPPDEPRRGGRWMQRLATRLRHPTADILPFRHP